MQLHRVRRWSIGCSTGRSRRSTTRAPAGAGQSGGALPVPIQHNGGDYAHRQRSWFTGEAPGASDHVTGRGSPRAPLGQRRSSCPPIVSRSSRMQAQTSITNFALTSEISAALQELSFRRHGDALRRRRVRGLRCAPPPPPPHHRRVDLVGRLCRSPGGPAPRPEPLIGFFLLNTLVFCARAFP
jgi:hypothetical protein